MRLGNHINTYPRTRFPHTLRQEHFGCRDHINVFIDPLYRRLSLGYEKCCLEGAVASGGGEVLGDHFKSGQRLSVQKRPTEVARPGLSCSTPPALVEASRFWCASSADHT